VEPDVVGPHVDPDPVVAEFTGSLASPAADHVDEDQDDEDDGRDPSGVGPC
jgi:hypothetical protein